MHQIVSPEVDSAEGPVLPTDDWAEQEVLKSTSGWVEVHKDCLVRHPFLHTVHFIPSPYLSRCDLRIDYGPKAHQ